MKKLTKKSLDELAKEMPVIKDRELGEINGGFGATAAVIGCSNPITAPVVAVFVGSFVVGYAVYKLGQWTFDYVNDYAPGSGNMSYGDTHTSRDEQDPSIPGTYVNRDTGLPNFDPRNPKWGNIFTMVGAGTAATSEIGPYIISGVKLVNYILRDEHEITGSCTCSDSSGSVYNKEDSKQ